MALHQLIHSSAFEQDFHSSPRHMPSFSKFLVVFASSCLNPFPARVCILLLACLLLPACNNTDTFILRQGFQYYSAQQADQAEAAADRFIAGNPNAPEIDQAYYLRGISRFTLGNSAGATSDLRLAIQKTTRAELRSKAYRALGDLAYDQEKWPDALKSYRAALDNLTLDPTLVNYLNYRVGAVLQAQGEWILAEPWFAKVIAARRDTNLTNRALQRMHARAFSLQFGAFQDASLAQTLAAQLRQGGIPAAVVTEARSDTSVWYLVQSGSYANYAEATVARDQVLPQIPVTVIVP